MRHAPPRGWHEYSGWGLVVPGLTFVVFDELKQATNMNPRSANARQREASMLGPEAKQGPHGSA